MVKVVLDTNVYVSGLIKRGSKPDRVLRRVESYHLFCCEEILREIERVLRYPRIKGKYGLSEEEIERYLVYIRSIATVVGCLPEVRVIDEDPADNIILACAESAGADYIVSGDRHLRKLREYKGIRILSPAEFLEITGCSPSEA